MTLGKANMAGLTSPQQRSEMKCILAGTWPPLKPLPVFKYETAAYRASIDFDKLRGEWVCRKISFPSNKVQELRGELRAITLTLPHGETEAPTEGTEEQEQELEKDANRRIQALREWKENYEAGAAYFELRNYLSQSQRSEADDSLRLSLTARQLQFNPKNIASVFDALSTAGGRFATLIELAKRNKGGQETPPAQEVQEIQEAQEEAALPETERAMGYGKGDQEIPDGCTDAGELPAVSIKNVFPEPYQDQREGPLAERASDKASEPFEVEDPEIADQDSPSLIEHFRQEARHSPAFLGLTAQAHSPQPSADRDADSPSRFPAIEISVFHLAGFATVFLFAVLAFAVGLRVGRSPVQSRQQESPKSAPAFDAKSPALPSQARETAPQISAPPVASSDQPASAGIGEPAPPQEKSDEQPANPVVSPNPAGLLTTAPEILAPIAPASAIVAAPHLPSSTLLVTFAGRGSQPFRVSFPVKTIAATHSLAMSAQLSVLISPQPRPAAARMPARLEAGELISFVWPRYPGLRDRRGMPQLIRVRAAIGPLGQVQDVKFLSGSTSLFPPTLQAIRQWRYRPTLLDQTPVQAQQDLTIEFYPPKSSPPSTRHPAQKLARSND